MKHATSGTYAAPTPAKIVQRHIVETGDLANPVPCLFDGDEMTTVDIPGEDIWIPGFSRKLLKQRDRLITKISDLSARLCIGQTQASVFKVDKGPLKSYEFRPPQPGI